MRKELRNWELKKMEYWNKKIISKVDFEYSSMLLLQYNNIEAYFLIDTTTYKITKKELTVVSEH
mgnify:CR=1 FL=1